MSTPERRKEIHHRVMVILGALTCGFALAGAWIAFGGGEGLPSWMYGRLGPAALQREPVVRRGGRPLVRFQPWSRETLAKARAQDRLILLHLCSELSRPCRVMEETTYADPGLARFLAGKVVAVRADADERPDIALRYLSAGWPATALLLPTGELLAEATFMSPERLHAWVSAIDEGFRRRRAEVSQAAFEAAAERVGASGPASAKPAAEERTAVRAKDSVLREWEPATLGFGRAARFPRFNWIAGLSDLRGEPWALELSSAAARGALSLEDPVWGGFYRSASGPGWQRPQYEKLLEDQAWAVAALERLEPAAAERTLAFVARNLAVSAGGYASGQAGEVVRPDGRVVEGSYYFSLPEARRRALGLPAASPRVLTGPSALMALAVLRSGLPGARAARAHALKTVDRLWAEAVEGGAARRSPRSGMQGLLADQVWLGRALLAQRAITGRAASLERALALARWCEEKLLDPKTGAFYDRPPRGELPAGLDRVLVPAWNAEAWRFLSELASALPEGDPRRVRIGSAAERLRAWLLSRPELLDPVLVLRLTRARRILI